MEGHEPRARRSRGVAPSAAGGAVGAIAGSAVGDSLVGALTGAVLSPAVTAVAEKAWFELVEARRLRHRHLLIGVAARLGEIDPDELMARAQQSDDHLGLLADAMRAASDTVSTRKVHSLALAVASGLRDDVASVDGVRLVVAALADLEEPHVKLLLKLPNQAYAPHSWHHDRRGDPLGPKSGESTTTDAILARLERNNLAESTATDVAMDWTDYAVEHASTQIQALIEESRYALPDAPSEDVHWHRTDFGTICAQYLRSGAELLDRGGADPQSWGEP